MSKVKYQNVAADIEDAMDAAVRVEDDFLPSPEHFAEMFAKEKISLNVDRSALKSFRDYAKKHGLKYQALMNQVLISYAKKLQS
jgi:predicted DNA binding CopG/RHH family protein